MNFRIVELKNIHTLSIKADKFPEGIDTAFNALESRLSTLKGRKFYGAVMSTPDGVVYRACIEKISGEKYPGIDAYVIPGGKYASLKMINWSRRTGEIKTLFNLITEKFSKDITRPQIEFYKSQKELILMLPVNA